jgi:anti-sigma B factor antagonist
MMMLTNRTESGWCVVGVRGRADAEAADELETALKAAVAEHGKVAADLSALSYISSAGLRALLEAARAAAGKGAEFVVCSISEPVKRVFDMSGMHHFLRVQGELPC